MRVLPSIWAPGKQQKIVKKWENDGAAWRSPKVITNSTFLFTWGRRASPITVVFSRCSRSGAGLASGLPLRRCFALRSRQYRRLTGCPGEPQVATRCSAAASGRPGCSTLPPAPRPSLALWTARSSRSRRTLRCPKTSPTWWVSSGLIFSHSHRLPQAPPRFICHTLRIPMLEGGGWMDG